MDCPRCGSFCSMLDERCDCGFDLTRAHESTDDVSPRKKRKKRKKQREAQNNEPDESVLWEDEDIEPVQSVQLDAWNEQHYATVLGMLFLALITCGLYVPYWYIKRQPFFDNLVERGKLGESLPWVAFCCTGFYLVIVLLTVTAGNASPDNAPRLATGFGNGVLGLYLAFYVRRIIHTAMRDAGQPVRLSAALTFLFNAYYLQYAMNRIARGTWGSAR